MENGVKVHHLFLTRVLFKITRVSFFFYNFIFFYFHFFFFSLFSSHLYLSSKLHLHLPFFLYHLHPSPFPPSPSQSSLPLPFINFNPTHHRDTRINFLLSSRHILVPPHLHVHPLSLLQHLHHSSQSPIFSISPIPKKSECVRKEMSTTHINLHKHLLNGWVTYLINFFV